MREKIKIFSYVMEKVLSRGIKNITMDDLAREMKISKKTIYKYFSSKEVIINLVFKVITKQVSAKFNSIIKQDVNAVVKFSEISRYFLQNAAKMSDNNLRYLKYQNPALWEKIDNFRAKTIYNNFKLIIEQGQREGLICDYPINIMLQIYVTSIRSIINPDYLINNSLSIKEAGETLISIIFKGVLTEKGLKVFEEYKKEVENEKN